MAKHRRRILWDTSAVSASFMDRQVFRTALAHLQLPAGLPMISAVTLQELAIFEFLYGNGSELCTWTARRFVTLPFDQGSALSAARMQELSFESPAKKKTAAEAREAVDSWSRDSAIIGTAVRHGVDVVVSADRDFDKFRKWFDGEIVVLPSVPLS